MWPSIATPVLGLPHCPAALQSEFGEAAASHPFSYQQRVPLGTVMVSSLIHDGRRQGTACSYCEMCYNGTFCGDPLKMMTVCYFCCFFSARGAEVERMPRYQEFQSFQTPLAECSISGISASLWRLGGTNDISAKSCIRNEHESKFLVC